jgi:hypothetical protein
VIADFPIGRGALLFPLFLLTILQRIIVPLRMKLEVEFKEISTLIQQAKENSFKAVNTELISLYLSIGEYISNKISTSAWGKSIVTNLANYLKLSDPNTKGFSAQNLWRMKQFFEAYVNNSKLSPLVREIT